MEQVKSCIYSTLASQAAAAAVATAVEITRSWTDSHGFSPFHQHKGGLAAGGKLAKVIHQGNISVSLQFRCFSSHLVFSTVPRAVLI